VNRRASSLVSSLAAERRPGLLEIDIGELLSDAAYAAQGSLYAKAMMKAMDGNCTNIAVLLQRYSDFCQRLSQDADPRLTEWIACIRARNQTCGGPGLP
jgi:hypothetical protein